MGTSNPEWHSAAGAKPLVSIITPTLNGGEFLAEAIESVRRQTYDQLEHLVIDGGSTDISQEILARAQHERLRYWSEPDDGQVHALVKGFERSRGEILAWLNADDIYLHEDVVAQVVDAFEANPEARIVTGGGIFLSAGARSREAIPAPIGLTLKEMRRVDRILQPATFFRRGILNATTIDRSLDYAFDWDFFVRALERNKLFVLDERLAGYRLHSGSKTFTGGSRRTREIAEVTRRNLGPRSWQYWTLRSVASVDRCLDALPGFARTPLRRFLYGGILRGLRTVGHGRLQT